MEADLHLPERALDAAPHKEQIAAAIDKVCCAEFGTLVHDYNCVEQAVYCCRLRRSSSNLHPTR